MKTKEIRDILCSALKKVEEGTLTAEESRAAIGLANQISQSLSVEVKVASMKLRMGQQADRIGMLEVS
jgi:hypothetical protein